LREQNCRAGAHRGFCLDVIPLNPIALFVRQVMTLAGPKLKLPSILLLAVCFFTGCEQTKPNTTTMSDAERQELLTIQANVDAALIEHSPFIYWKLSPPATEAEFAMLRKYLGDRERPYLESWYKWHNGCRESPVELLPGGRFLSIAETIEDRNSIQKMTSVHARRKRDVKLLDDGSGDGFFLDLSSSTPRVYHEILENRNPTDFGTMSQFLEFIAKVHSSGIASLSGRNKILFDLPAYHKLEAEYLDSISGN
jgi:hypothetical protein